jgi:putative tryptophan/tyrosine transport system substrate-binding protein
LPLAARAQEAGRVYRLGILIPATRESIAAFFDELRSNGFVEGQNLDVIGSYSVRAEQIAGDTAALIKAAPDVILCGSRDLCACASGSDAHDTAGQHERGSGR